MTEPTLSPLMAGSVPVGFLVVESGSLVGQRFPLPQAPGALLLGRERICNVRFDPDRERLVGRTHARIEVRPDGLYLVDLNSANGTFREDGGAVRGAIPLNAGMRFQLGGEGGPWLSVQISSSNQAVHVSPPQSQVQTLISRPTDQSAIVHLTSPVPPASAAKPVPVLPSPQRESELPVVPVIPPASFGADPVALEHRKQFRRQVVIISVLLLSACLLGLLFGIRDDGAGSSESGGNVESQ